MTARYGSLQTSFDALHELPFDRDVKPKTAAEESREQEHLAQYEKLLRKLDDHSDEVIPTTR